jgi:TIGR03009 family protein
MRKTLTLLALTAAAGVAAAQTPPGGQPPVSLNPAGQAAAQPPAAQLLNPTGNRLDALLLQWEQKMKGISALHAELTRTDYDAFTKQSKTWQGWAKILRPDRAHLYLKSASDPNIFEQYVFTGTHLWEVRPQNKIMRVHEIAAKPGQPVEDNFLNFLFGMKADDAKRRYDLTLAKEDQHYVYILVTAKTPSDRTDFTQARLVLFNNTFLPRQLIFETPNQDRINWDIPRIDPAAKVTTADFVQPRVPADWKIEKVPAAQPTGAAPPPQPSKVRPNGG